MKDSDRVIQLLETIVELLRGMRAQQEIEHAEYLKALNTPLFVLDNAPLRE